MSSKQVVAAVRSESSGGYVSGVKKAYESSVSSSTTHSSSSHSSGIRHSSGSTYIGGGSTLIGSGSAISSSGSYSITNGSTLINGSSTFVGKEYSEIIGITRIEEREEFIALNARLDKYIQTVRGLRLTKKEVNDLIFGIQDLQLTTIKKRVFENYREQISQQQNIRDELRGSIGSLKLSLQIMTDNYNAEHEKASRLQERLNQLLMELKRLREVNSQLKYSLDKEEVTHEETIKTRINLREIVQATIDRYAKEYADLQLELINTRNEFARLIQDVKIDAKFGAVNIDHVHVGSKLVVAQNDVRHYHALYEKLQIQAEMYERTIASYQRQIAAWKEKIEFVVDDRSIMEQIEAKYRMELDSYVRSYKLLLQENIQLIAELNTYHRLLCEEENRLHIVRVVDQHTGHGFVVKSNSEIDVVIEEVSMKGDFVRLTNKGQHEFDLASWSLVAQAGGDSKTFKLQPSHPLQPGKTMTIWSPNRGGTHSPPENYVMKNVTWPSGNRLFVQLLDKSGVMKACVTSYNENS